MRRVCAIAACVLLVQSGCKKEAPKPPVQVQVFEEPEDEEADEDELDDEADEDELDDNEDEGAEAVEAVAKPAPDSPTIEPSRTPKDTWRGRVSLDVKQRAAVGWSDVEAGSNANIMGLRYHKRRKFHLALAQYELAVAANPNQVYARYNAACAHAQLGQKQPSLELLKTIGAMGGHIGRKQLTHARKDNDFIMLWRDLEFVRLTDTDAPEPVWMGAADVDIELDGVASDPNEKICVWLETKDDARCMPSWIRVAECGTSKRVFKRDVVTKRQCAQLGDGDAPAAVIDKARAAALATDAWLQALGMRQWRPLTGSRLAQVEAWFDEHLQPEVARWLEEEEFGGAYVSPSGKLVAIQHVHPSDDMEWDAHASYTIKPAGEVLGRAR